MTGFYNRLDSVTLHPAREILDTSSFTLGGSLLVEINIKAPGFWQIYPEPLSTPQITNQNNWILRELAVPYWRYLSTLL